MRNQHGSSRRQAYGRRMKDLRTRRGANMEIDLEGPSGWSRGSSWDDEGQLHRPDDNVDNSRQGTRPR